MAQKSFILKVFPNPMWTRKFHTKATRRDEFEEFIWSADFLSVHPRASQIHQLSSMTHFSPCRTAFLTAHKENFNTLGTLDNFSRHACRFFRRFLSSSKLPVEDNLYLRQKISEFFFLLSGARLCGYLETINHCIRRLEFLLYHKFSGTI